MELFWGRTAGCSLQSHSAAYGCRNRDPESCSRESQGSWTWQMEWGMEAAGQPTAVPLPKAPKYPSNVDLLMQI